MELNVIAAMIAGLAGTAVMTGMMFGAKKLHLPAVDVHGILGFVQNANKAGSLGYIMHFVLGAVFAIGYAFVFTVFPGNILLWGAVLGMIHWLLVGWMFAFAPVAHAGMKAGLIAETGPFMLKSLGVVGFVAGMAGHMVYGVVVALVYGLLAS